MSVSTKELFTAFFKGLAFAKGLNFGEKNRGMAEDRWITIHPGGDLDVNRRIEIDDDGTILKGGAMSLLGTNIKDLSKNYANKSKVEGVSIKSTDRYREKENSLNEGLSNAGKQRNKEDYSGALNTIKEIEPNVFKHGRKIVDYYDTVSQHPEVSEKIEEFKKKTEKLQREKIDSERTESNMLQHKDDTDRFNKHRDEKVKENPLKNEKMEKAVDDFNTEVAENLQKLKNSRDIFSKVFKREREAILSKIGTDLDEQKLSDQDLDDLIKRIRRVEFKGYKLAEKISDYKKEAIEKFTELTQSKTKNKGRFAHYLKNLNYGTPLGDFAFNSPTGRVPDTINWPHGGSIINTLYDEKQRRERLKNFS